MAMGGTRRPCADHSKPWITVAALLFVFGERADRRAAVAGMVAVGIDSAIVNLPLKLLGRRPPPERDDANGPPARHVPMPRSYSFPSGHAAAGFAFAGGVATSRPTLAWGLRGLATVVACSRIHTGVHYPGDVLLGALVGAATGEASGRLIGRLWR